MAVGQRRFRVFRGNQLLDQRADGGGRRRAARIGRDVAAEEILELERAARRQHVLLRGDPRDRRFVQRQHVGDFAQHHRPHRDLSVLEEAALALDDGFRDAQDRVEALLHVADQPLGLLQLRRELLVRRFAIARQDIGVDAIEAQLGHRHLVERRGPLATDLAHDHVGDHVVRLVLGECRAGSRAQAADQFPHGLDAGVVAMQHAL